MSRAEQAGRLTARGVAYLAVGATAWTAILWTSHYIEQMASAAGQALLSLPGVSAVVLAASVGSFLLLSVLTGWTITDIVAGWLYG